MDTKSLVLELEPHSLLSLSDSKGALVQCLHGTIWITEENDRNDVVLQPGEGYELSRQGRAIVQAIRGARIAVTGKKRDRPHFLGNWGLSPVSARPVGQV